MKTTFTRDELMAIVAVEPCHVTGMHDPKHTTTRVCDIQKRNAFDRLMEALGIASDAELPRRLHDKCYWCHDQEGLDESAKASRRELAAWAAEVPVP